MRTIDADKLKKVLEKNFGHTGGAAVLAQLIDAQDTIQPEPHWIPVTERLPEDDTVVLVCGKSGGIYTAIHNNSKAWIRGWWKMNSKNHYCDPVAWMPLPHPVRLEKNNG